jgi:hypothetical protein
MAMNPEFVNGNVRADCPDCGVPVTFEFRSTDGSGEFGSVIKQGSFPFNGKTYSRVIYKTLRCSVCSRPAVATVYCGNSYSNGSIGDFWPTSRPKEILPDETPDYIINELREAEACMEAKAWRASAAMLRSTLEKTLNANGYNQRNLYQKIETVGNDGVITSARRQRAQDLIRTLGNDVLHDDWREVNSEEVKAVYKYVSRIIEDFYDDRETVVSVLVEKQRISNNNNA